MNRPSLSEADLRLTAKAIDRYRTTLIHNARGRGGTVREGRLEQLERLHLLYSELADRARQPSPPAASQASRRG